MPKKRHATLTVQGPEDQSLTFMADFDQLTLASTQVGGYQRQPNGVKPITSAAAAAFWEDFEKLAAKGLRSGCFDMLDGVVWKFTAYDGKKTHEATGAILDGVIIDDEQEEDSYAELAALFRKLSK